jgi:hypothetical protein
MHWARSFLRSQSDSHSTSAHESTPIDVQNKRSCDLSVQKPPLPCYAPWRRGAMACHTIKHRQATTEGGLALRPPGVSRSSYKDFRDVSAG